MIALTLVFQLFLGIAFPSVVAAQGDGPRAYQLVPEGTQSISQFVFALRGNNTPSNGLVVPGAKLDVNLGLTQYGRAFDIDGHQAGVLLVLPMGNVSGSLSTGLGKKSSKDSGIGDVLLGFVYGLYGSPNLSQQEYVKYDPGFSMAILARATLPTGSYDSSRSLNMGGNRWVFEFGLPIMYYLGSSYLDPALTTFEIQPKITLYSVNSDASGTAQRLEQDPLLSVEGHITRNFGQVFWGSFDALFEYGGETTSDGIADDNKQRSLSLGVTAAMNLSPSSSVKVSYGEVVSGNPSGSRGRMLRLQYLLLF